MVLGGSHVFIQTPPRCGVLSCQKNNQPFQRKLQKQWALVIPCRIFKASSKRVTSVRHTHCGYRETSSVHPRHATKGRFSDDNLLIRSILHFFVSFFSLSPFFFYETLHLAYHSYSISFVFCRAQRLAYHFYSVSSSFCHTQWLAKVFQHLRYIEKFCMKISKYNRQIIRSISTSFRIIRVTVKHFGILLALQPIELAKEIT